MQEGRPECIECLKLVFVAYCVPHLTGYLSAVIIVFGFLFCSSYFFVGAHVWRGSRNGGLRLLAGGE